VGGVPSSIADAAEWFVRMAALVGDQWHRPGLGEWDVRDLVGHTSLSLLTVEMYLARPAGGVEVASATDYFRATRAAAADPAVAARARDAGTALGQRSVPRRTFRRPLRHRHLLLGALTPGRGRHPALADPWRKRVAEPARAQPHCEVGAGEAV
jgi:hypothetical protein